MKGAFSGSIWAARSQLNRDWDTGEERIWVLARHIQRKMNTTGEESRRVRCTSQSVSPRCLSLPRWRTHGTWPFKCACDIIRFVVRQCLVNLVGNAIKFTERGHVHVNARTIEDGGKPFVRFDVVDAGIGIPADKRQAIFDSFTQADGGTARKYGGTGLGLSITRQLVELLGGRIYLESAPGKGSTFSFEIPVGLDGTSAPTQEHRDLPDCQAIEFDQSDACRTGLSGRVLVAEDVPANQRLIRHLLEREGLEVSLAADGDEAISKALLESFDVILMDMQMPNTNGRDATRALRKRGMKTPIIALTAEAMTGDERRCLKAGCDDYLSKPIDRKRLFSILGRYLSCRERRKEEQEMRHEPVKAIRETIDAIAEQADEMNRLMCDEPVAESLPGRDAAGDVECVIDFEQLISRVVDEDLIGEIMPVCVDDNRQRLEMLAEAVGKNDGESIKSCAHSIKGSAANLGAMRLSEPACRLEQLASEGDLSKARELLEEIRTEFDKLETFVGRPDWMQTAKEQSKAS